MNFKAHFIGTMLAIAFGLATTGLSQTYPNVIVDNTSDYQAETATAIHPLDPLRLIAGANSGSPAGIPSVKAYYSSSGGDAWSIKTDLPKPLWNGAADPSVAFDRNGNWYYGYINYSYNLGFVDYGTVFVAKSSDNGTSWTAIQVNPNKLQSDFEDKCYIAVDNTSSTSNYKGRVYVSWTLFPFSGGSSIRFAYSTFTPPISFSSPITLSNATGGGVSDYAVATQTAPGSPGAAPLVQGSVPAIGTNGEVYVMWVSVNSSANGSAGTIQVRKSTNGGVSFTTLPQAATVTNANGNFGAMRIRTYIGPTIAVDQNNGYVYITWTELRPGNDLDVYFVRSTNGGTSWSTPIRATENSTNLQFFPWLSVDPTGKVNLTYIQTVGGTSSDVNVYVAESFNNGVSFSVPNKRITSLSSAPNVLPGVSWSHDYQGITSTVGFSYPVWADYRLGGGDILASRVESAVPTSNTANATVGNGQRKIARQSNGDNHLVFETNQEIYYARKTTTDPEWRIYKRLSSGTGGNSSPCIAERAGNVYVVWQQYDAQTSSYNIVFHKSINAGGSWPDVNRQPLTSSLNLPFPVIISPATTKLTVVYRNSSGLGYKISDNDGASWTPTSQIPSTGANDNSPTLAPALTFWSSARSALVYANTASVIYYRYYKNGTDSTGWNASAKSLSQIVPGSYNSHQKPSISPNAYSGVGPIHVAWEARSGTTGNYYVIIHRKATNWATWPNVYSATYYEQQKLPSITGLANDTAELLFQLTTQNLIYKQHYNGTYWGAPVFVGAGKNPSVSVGNTTAKYVWTDGSASPYQIKTSTETLSKVNELTVAYHRSIAVIDTTTSAWLDVRFDKLSVKTKSGSEFIIPFESAKEDAATLTPANAFANLASPPVFLPADAESLAVSYQVSGQGLSAVRNASGTIDADIILTGKDGATLGLPILRATSENLVETKLLLAAPISAFAGREISLSTQVSGIKSSLIASLGHIYEFVEEPLPQKLASSTETTTAREFAFTAYPNPFNPSTQIRFTLASESLVTLRIYNIAGQMVRELLHEQQRAAGEHTVLWDGHNESGRATASGIYFMRLESGNKVKISKLTLVR